MSLKDDWLKALRSGNYKQCQGKLRRDDKFCCLGVVCDIKDQAKWKTAPNMLWDDKENTLPLDLLDELKLTADQQRQLIQMNDCDKLDFNTIASWIEANVH